MSSLRERPPLCRDMGAMGRSLIMALLLACLSLCLQVTRAVLPVRFEICLVRRYVYISPQVNRHFSAARGQRAPGLECLVGLDSVTLSELYMVSDQPSLLRST